MKSSEKRDQYYIPYINMIIRCFSNRYQIDYVSGFEYLYQFKGIHYLEQFYDVEHLLPINDTLDSLQSICQKNGGLLK
ncbi:MAG: DUF3791 domain-containing protein [Proteobacteria bacterium]|nr:DUF3791 domain-containing protein [Pseudomonadota bacterium]